MQREALNELDNLKKRKIDLEKKLDKMNLKIEVIFNQY